MPPKDDPRSAAHAFVHDFVAKKAVSLSGIDWHMVVATLDESAANCFRCKNKGCDVCRMTKAIARNIEGQL